MVIGCGVRQFMVRQPAGEIAKRSIRVKDEPVPSIVGGHNAGIINGNEATPWPWQVSIQVVLYVLMTLNSLSSHSLHNVVLVKFFIYNTDIQR